MPIAIKFTPILPERDYFNKHMGGIFGALLDALGGPVFDHLSDEFQKRTKNWSPPMKPSKRVFVQVRQFRLDVMPAGPGSKKWRWVSGGTKAHPIVARRKPFLRIKEGYDPKTGTGDRYGVAGAQAVTTRERENVIGLKMVGCSTNHTRRKEVSEHDFIFNCPFHIKFILPLFAKIGVQTDIFWRPRHSVLSARTEKVLIITPATLGVALYKIRTNDALFGSAFASAPIYHTALTNAFGCEYRPAFKLTTNQIISLCVADHGTLLTPTAFRFS